MTTMDYPQPARILGLFNWTRLILMLVWSDRTPEVAIGLNVDRGNVMCWSDSTAAEPGMFVWANGIEEEGKEKIKVGSKKLERCLWSLSGQDLYLEDKGWSKIQRESNLWSGSLSIDSFTHSISCSNQQEDQTFSVWLHISELITMRTSKAF